KLEQEREDDTRYRNEITEYRDEIKKLTAQNEISLEAETQALRAKNEECVQRLEALTTNVKDLDGFGETANKSTFSKTNKMQSAQLDFEKELAKKDQEHRVETETLVLQNERLVKNIEEAERERELMNIVHPLEGNIEIIQKENKELTEKLNGLTTIIEELVSYLLSKKSQ
ncbi:hypothetical protein DXG01_013048, partial [Tephrocybe rancida]